MPTLPRRRALAALAAPLTLPLARARAAEPLRVAIAGLVHGHIQGFIKGLRERTDMKLVGIAEADAELARAIADKHKLADVPLTPTVDKMLDAVKPQAVLTFTSTYDHAAVVAACASRGVHVMMEKPLA